MFLRQQLILKNIFAFTGHRDVLEILLWYNLDISNEILVGNIVSKFSLKLWSQLTNPIDLKLLYLHTFERKVQVHCKTQ